MDNTENDVQVRKAPARKSCNNCCVRYPEEIASAWILWQPLQGRLNRGRKQMTYVDNLMKGANMERMEKLRSLMPYKDTWREVVKNCSRGSGWRPA